MTIVMRTASLHMDCVHYQCEGRRSWKTVSKCCCLLSGKRDLTIATKLVCILSALHANTIINIGYYICTVTEMVAFSVFTSTFPNILLLLDYRLDEKPTSPDIISAECSVIINTSLCTVVLVFLEWFLDQNPNFLGSFTVYSMVL